MPELDTRRIDAVPLLCVLAALLLVGLRIVLLFDFTDAATGFYTSLSIFSSLFNALYILYLLLLTFLLWPASFNRCVVPQRDAPLGLAALLMGGAVLFQAVWDAWLGRHTPVAPASAWLRWSALLFALCAGCVFLVLTGELLMGRPFRSATSGAFAIVVLYRCFLLLEAFTRHVVTAFVSEHMLETLLLVLGVLFSVTHARVLSGRSMGIRLLIWSGYAYVATCAALYLPDILGLLLNRTTIEPEMVGRMVQATATAIYCFGFLLRITKNKRAK